MPAHSFSSVTEGKRPGHPGCGINPRTEETSSQPRKEHAHTEESVSTAKATLQRGLVLQEGFGLCGEQTATI